MRARDVVGRRIVAVRHDRAFNKQTGRMATLCCEIELDDGSRLRAHAVEFEFEPQGDIIHAKAEKKRQVRGS